MNVTLPGKNLLRMREPWGGVEGGTLVRRRNMQKLFVERSKLEVSTWTSSLAG